MTAVFDVFIVFLVFSTYFVDHLYQVMARVQTQNQEISQIISHMSSPLDQSTCSVLSHLLQCLRMITISGINSVLLRATRLKESILLNKFSL